MAAKTRYGVHFTYTPANDQDRGGLLLEQLRYAQVVRTEDQPDGSVSVILLPPHGVDSQAWARMNSQRMQSHRFMDATPVVVL